MGVFDDVKQLRKPYYLVNTFLSLSFPFLKTCSPFCNYIFAAGDSQCELDMVNSNSRYISNNKIKLIIHYFVAVETIRDLVFPPLCGHDEGSKVRVHYNVVLPQLRFHVLQGGKHDLMVLCWSKIWIIIWSIIYM